MSSTSYRRGRITIEQQATPWFEQWFLFDITIADVERYKQTRVKTVSPAMVNKELNTLNAMLNKAVTWGYLKANPLTRMSGLKEPLGRLRYLAPEETARLLEACTTPVYLRPIVELAMHIGMRRSEILALCWRDVELRRRILSLTQIRNNERRMIPINDTVAAVLKTWPRVVGTDALFPGLNRPMVTRAFRWACRKAGVSNLRLHDLRHTFASYLALGGYNLRTIQQLLGHKDLRMTSRYAHLSDDHLQQAVKSLDLVLDSNTVMDTLRTPEEETR
jgi:integrase